MAVVLGMKHQASPVFDLVNIMNFNFNGMI